MTSNNAIRVLGILAAVLAVLFATSASAAQPDLVARDVYAGGGQDVSAGDFRLVGTVGEAVVAPIAATGDFQEGAGFWAKLQPIRETFLPLLTK